MGLICLQGGNEFADACRDMDAYLLERAAGGLVVVLPYAATPGRDQDTVVANATAYYRSLGAAEVASGAERLGEAALVVIPGGSPRRLAGALAPLKDALAAAAADPTTVVTGSSAGAMLLCATTVLPEPFGTGEGVGLVDDFAVIPHYDHPRPDWEDALRDAAPGIDLLGIPECSGVLLDGESVTAIGARPSVLVTEDGREELAIEG
ncbi:MAG TPA: Type 1 glutamine amidotransferase-like domain-containing protein [Frankiaceae bacterium]|jgi:putative intracellular protease/amidase|nr:Type 1 glutamine amidotransferase-like domain-containing protein [Frankiaceae bacterium]